MKSYETVRQRFIQRAMREAERKLGVPAGWCGTYHDVRGPKGVRVHFSSSAWTVSIGGVRVSRHDSRSFAIRKAVKMTTTFGKRS